MQILGVGFGLFPGREVATGITFHVLADVQERLGVAPRLPV